MMQPLSRSHSARLTLRTIRWTGMLGVPAFHQSSGIKVCQNMKTMPLFHTAWLCLLVAAHTLCAADFARKGATETALDRYIARPDPSYQWKLADMATFWFRKP